MNLPALTGCISLQASAGGGGGITAADNLQHWWKMNDGSTTEALDYGLSADVGTDLTMSGVTSEAGGPSENGTPDYVDFDGALANAWTLLVDGSGNTPVGDLVDVGYDWTFSIWLKDDRTSLVQWETGWNCGAPWGTEGFGVFATASGEKQNYFLNGYGSGKVTVASAVPTSGWRNIIITFDRQSADNNYMKVYFDGSLEGSYGPHADTINTSVGTTVNQKLSFGGIVSTGEGLSYVSKGSMSDIRMYNRVLSGAEITAIAAGDW